MDNADISVLETEHNLKIAMYKHKNKDQYKNITPEGYCHHCFEEVNDKKLFCDNKCANEYSRINTYR